MRSIKIVQKLIIAMLFTFLFAFLGIFSGSGYHLYQINETSFVSHGQSGYADASFKLNMAYDPLLYPYYWILGVGRVNGTFSMMYVPDAYGPSGRPYYGTQPSERYQTYILHMLTWGTLPNVVILFILAIAIEIIGRRSLYLVAFGGILGFYAYEVLGATVGVVAGSVALFVLLKLWRDNPVMRFWNSLWE